MKITILGTGAYGLALCSILENNGHNITLWTKFNDEKDDLEKNRNSSKLSNYKIGKDVKITSDFKESINNTDLIILAIPAAFVRESFENYGKYIKRDTNILIATKGIEQETGMFINQIVNQYVKSRNIAVISGPSFAKDIVNKMPIGLSVASKSKKTISLVKNALENNYIKLRPTKDIIGVEICGAIKNVIAIASGILTGLEENDSTSAMFLTEATHDMMEILSAFGGKRKTVVSYAGIGDLLLTCSSRQSRNFVFGQMIGSRKSKEEIDKYLKNTTVEGYYTLESIYKLLKNKKVNIPTINLIYNIVVNKEDPSKLLSFIIIKK